MVAALLRVAGVTAGLAESNGSLPPGLWLTSPAGWLLRTGISSGTLRSVIEYGQLLPFYLFKVTVWQPLIKCCLIWLDESATAPISVRGTTFIMTFQRETMNEWMNKWRRGLKAWIAAIRQRHCRCAVIVMLSDVTVIIWGSRSTQQQQQPEYTDPSVSARSEARNYLRRWTDSQYNSPNVRTGVPRYSV